METSLTDLIIWIESSKHVLLFLGCLIQGPIVTLASGFLLSIHAFNFFPMYIALLLGNICADMAWYAFGRFGTRSLIFKYGYFLGITPEKFKKIESYFSLYHQKILIFFKLTAGLGFTILALIAAGMFKVPFKKYFFLMLICNIIWILLILFIGYSFGNVFMVMSVPMKIISSIFIIAIIIFGTISIKRWMKKKGI